MDNGRTKGGTKKGGQKRTKGVLDRREAKPNCKRIW
jgi:hypothetical protein